MKMRGGIVTGALAGCLVLLGTWVSPAGGVVFTVACPGQSLQTAVNNACSGDAINVTGTCSEAVTVANANAGCPGGAIPFTQLRINAGGKGAGAAVVNGVGGPGITVTANARNIQIEGFTVGSDTNHGIAVLGAHRVKLTNITTPSGVGTVDDGIHVDTASTRVEVLSSTLNGNPGDGVEMGATYGRVNNVTANDNGAVGFHLTGSHVDVQRCTAIETSAALLQLYGFLTAGDGVITQRCLAHSNIMAQYFDSGPSAGVIHFRDIAGNSSATAVPAGSGAGFWVSGYGNRISSSTVIKNAGPGVRLAGDGNQLHRSTVSQNVGAQVLVEGDRNFIDAVSATRVSTGVFASTDPAYEVLAGSQYNYFRGNRASVVGTTVGDGFTIPDATTTGERNTRSPAVAGDPPAALQ